jgi:hypothetical protein
MKTAITIIVALLLLSAAPARAEHKEPSIKYGESCARPYQYKHGRMSVLKSLKTGVSCGQAFITAPTRWTESLWTCGPARCGPCIDSFLRRCFEGRK